VGLSGIWGQFDVTLDDKGRFMLPAKLRKSISGDNLVITKGVEQCLWLFLPEEWERVSDSLIQESSIFNLDSQDVIRRFIAPAEEVSVDKSGRLKLVSSLMRSVGLVRESVLVGMGDRIEIWDSQRYEEFEQSRSEAVKDTWKEIGKGQSGDQQ
jgi:MraZ protein